MTLLWLCLILFLLYYAFILAQNLLAYPKIIEAIKSGAMKRTQLYARMMAGLWIPALAIFLVIAFGGFTLSDVGILRREFPCPEWLRIASIVAASVYFLFLLVQFIVLRRSARQGKDSGQDIPERLRVMLPVSGPEKRMWAATAVTAGICEELIFRGFLLQILTALFPALPLAAALVAATLLFGAGHLYQGIGEAVKPLLIGLMFGVFYIAFGSILPCIALHALQDLEATWAVNA